MKQTKGPQFLRYFVPILEVLQELGGSGTTTEVIDSVIEKLNIPESELEKTLKNGGSRVKNQIAWARFYLLKSDFLHNSERGIWSLTEKGLKAPVEKLNAIEHFKEVQDSFSKKGELQDDSASSESQSYKEVSQEVIDQIEDDVDYKIKLLNILRSLPPSGFERICQLLLRKSGFQQVVVTGKPRDDGIDGHGVLQMNPFVSFKVLFQCKRYQSSVSVSQVRDFRGAMMGRADKGIIITTGSFTQDAKKEALRDGVPPIELVDGDQLVEMFQLVELGLKPKVVYEVDLDFFEPFSK